MERLLGNQLPKLKYFGVLRSIQKDVLQQFENMIYDAWDTSSESPPQQRARSETERPALSILTWQNGCPQIPENVLRKFPAGTRQEADILKFKEELETLWPTPASVPGTRPAGEARTAGAPDLTGASILDLSREIDLPHIALTGFQVERPDVFLLLSKNFMPNVNMTKDGY